MFLTASCRMDMFFHVQTDMRAASPRGPWIVCQMMSIAQNTISSLKSPWRNLKQSARNSSPGFAPWRERELMIRTRKKWNCFNSRCAAAPPTDVLAPINSPMKICSMDSYASSSAGSIDRFLVMSSSGVISVSFLWFSGSPSRICMKTSATTVFNRRESTWMQPAKDWIAAT
jgi:hypothetical protein